MSKKFLVPIDLNQLEIQNVRLQNLATAPGSPVAGQMYYNTTTNKAMIYNGSTWVPWEADTSVIPATTTPAMDGTAAVGVSAKYAREDHVHPSDTTRVPTSRTVNGKALSSNISLTSDDISIPADVISEYVSELFKNSEPSTLSQLTSTADIMARDVEGKVDAESGKGLSTNDYTTTEKNKLSGIAAGAEVNQNAFSNVKIGSTTVAADAKTDTLELAAGSNVTLTPDATNDKVTIAATDTKYEAGTTALITSGTDTTERVWQAKILHDYIGSIVGGADAMRFLGTIGTGGDITELPTSGVKIGDTYRVITAGTYAGQTCEIGDLIIATATTPTWTVAQTNIDGAITSISGTAPISVTGSGSSRTVSISAASESAAGSMSSAHYTKLEGIEAGAQVNRTYTSTTGKPTANQTPGFGNTFTISQVSQSTTGQITTTDRTVKIPNATATTITAGLMSASDKVKLEEAACYAEGNATITAGNTSVSLGVDMSGSDIRGYVAKDASTQEEVVVDFSSAGTGTFSIASAYANDIRIDWIAYV